MSVGLQYRIGEFARVSGVSAKTLRFYDEIGLFRPASVNPLTGYRYYHSQQLEELASILALKDLGVPLARIRRLSNKVATTAGRHELLNELKNKLERSIETAGLSLKWVNAELDALCDSKRPIPVVVKRIGAIPIASVRSRVNAYEEIDRFEQELLKSLPAEVIGEPRGVLWHHCADSGYLEGEPFVALKSTLPRRSFYHLTQLPEAILACAYSKSDNDSAELAYGTIRRWMERRGYRLVGPKREIDLRGTLEIQFPISAA